jgi:hypothetical protein
VVSEYRRYLITGDHRICGENGPADEQGSVLAVPPSG